MKVTRTVTSGWREPFGVVLKAWGRVNSYNVLFGYLTASLRPRFILASPFHPPTAPQTVDVTFFHSKRWMSPFSIRARGHFQFRQSKQVLGVVFIGVGGLASHADCH